MTSLSAPYCPSCHAYHLQVSEPVTMIGPLGRMSGCATVQVADVPVGRWHRSDPIRDAWIRVEVGRALRVTPKGGDENGAK